MSVEGAEKTWDQCRIKLKNLKSQYRYVKEGIPNVDHLNLENDEAVKQLIAMCQEKGISPACIKHIRFLRRFMLSQAEMAERLPIDCKSELLAAGKINWR